jgi:hypothetical protein
MNSNHTLCDIGKLNNYRRWFEDGEDLITFNGALDTIEDLLKMNEDEDKTRLLVERLSSITLPMGLLI